MQETTLLQFIKALSSKAPVPGGGGASALAGAIGTALASMVGNLTSGYRTNLRGSGAADDKASSVDRGGRRCV